MSRVKPATRQPPYLPWPSIVESKPLDPRFDPPPWRLCDAALEQVWLHACGIIGRHRHYWRARGAAAAGRTIGSRGGPADTVQEQSQTDWTGAAQLSRHVPKV